METNKPELDNNGVPLYNNSNDGQVLRIDRRNLKPINDPKCKHEFYEDPNDADAGQFKVFKCRSCPIGYLETR